MRTCCLVVTLMLSFWTLQAQNKYTFVFLNSNPNKEVLPKKKVDSLQEGHLNNIGRLAREGKLLVAGPFDGGGGIFIMNTPLVKEAKSWINTDPAIAANRYRIEILPWTPRVGGACLADTDAEFATYTFIRYNTFITKFNVQQAPQHFKRHDDYIEEIAESGNVISEGVFANSDGGTMILKGDLDQELIMNDPAVQNGIIQPDIKKIWVAKGSFCEK